MAYTTIDKPSVYFNTVFYTGNFSTQSITGVGFQPDWVWIKERSVSGNHQLQNSVNGTNSKLMSNSTSAEGTDTNYITSFDSDGFSIGANNGNNQSGVTHVAWNWLAGGSASSNTNGDITSSVSANTTSGFSIVSYTGNGSAGQTVGHGVGSALDMIIVKKRSSSAQWVVGHKAMDSTFDNFLFLDATSAKGNADNVFNDTAPTSSVFSIGNAGDTNASSQTYTAFCFSQVKGFSKFGTFAGNGNSDGSYVYTGFKPAFVMVKDSTSDGQWFMRDSKRDTYNPAVKTVYANGVPAEENSQPWDMLSNGFKMRNTDTDLNNSGETYIYMAFAEAPFVTSTGIPTTAR